MLRRRRSGKSRALRAHTERAPPVSLCLSVCLSVSLTLSFTHSLFVDICLSFSPPSISFFLSLSINRSIDQLAFALAKLVRFDPAGVKKTQVVSIYAPLLRSSFMKKVVVASYMPDIGRSFTHTFLRIDTLADLQVQAVWDALLLLIEYLLLGLCAQTRRSAKIGRSRAHTHRAGVQRQHRRSIQLKICSTCK